MEFGIAHCQSLLGIVPTEIFEHSVALPHDLVVVPVINQRGDTAIGHHLAIPFLLVLLLAKVKEAFFVCESQLIEQNENLKDIDAALVIIDGKLIRRVGRHD